VRVDAFILMFSHAHLDFTILVRTYTVTTYHLQELIYRLQRWATPEKPRLDQDDDLTETRTASRYCTYTMNLEILDEDGSMGRDVLCCLELCIRGQPL